MIIEACISFVAANDCPTEKNQMRASADKRSVVKNRTRKMAQIQVYSKAE
jgi:hypothetical protein